MFGVDEAGRGPVLGSMFVACVAVDSLEALPEGLRDSKRLSNTRIATLANTLHTTADIRIAIVEIPIERIDDPEETMTTVTVDAFSEAIKAASHSEEDGILDACHTDADKFGSLVASASSRNSESFGSEHGADESYPVVSAASIVAKDARERHVAELREEYGELGSGYPSDSTTREFLEKYVAKNRNLPPCTRHSWKTATTVLEEAGLEPTELSRIV